MLMAKHLIRSLRLKQIVKNGFLFVGLIFSRKFLVYPDNLNVFLGFCCFCLISWAVYLFNDIQDRELDRNHPKKRNRPIASGALPVAHAYGWCILLLIVGLIGSYWIAWSFFIYCVLYIVLNILYSLKLKHVVLLDIMAISAGFWLRVIAGTQIIHVQVTHWLIVCSIFLSLFLGFCKRRSEVNLTNNHSRPILKEYSTLYLDQLIAALTASVILSYILYTISDETIARFGTDALLLSAPFVLYGVFRYLYLIYCQDRGEDTASDLLSDRPLLLAAAGWMISVALVIYL